MVVLIYFMHAETERAEQAREIIQREGHAVGMRNPQHFDGYVEPCGRVIVSDRRPDAVEAAYGKRGIPVQRLSTFLGETQEQQKPTADSAITLRVNVDASAAIEVPEHVTAAAERASHALDHVGIDAGAAINVSVAPVDNAADGADRPDGEPSGLDVMFSSAPTEAEDDVGTDPAEPGDGQPPAAPRRRRQSRR